MWPRTLKEEEGGEEEEKVGGFSHSPNQKWKKDFFTFDIHPTPRKKILSKRGDPPLRFFFSFFLHHSLVENPEEKVVFDRTGASLLFLCTVCTW